MDVLRWIGSFLGCGDENPVLIIIDIVWPLTWANCFKTEWRGALGEACVRSTWRHTVLMATKCVLQSSLESNCRLPVCRALRIYIVINAVHLEENLVIDLRLSSLKAVVLDWVAGALKELSERSDTRKHGWAHLVVDDLD